MIQRQENVLLIAHQDGLGLLAVSVCLTSVKFSYCRLFIAEDAFDLQHNGRTVCGGVESNYAQDARYGISFC